VGVEEVLGAARDELLAELTGFQRDIDGVLAAARESNADDEHDPEGATLAFERAQLLALRAATRHRLAEVEQALDRLRAGSYPSCRACGRPIGADRLAARPASTLCIDCAARP
jgi:DnaK suppressor protein